MQILDLVLEHTLVLIGGVYDVCYAQIAYDLPVLRLYGAPNVDLTLDDAIGINGQVFVSIHGRSYVQMRAHEAKLVIKAFVAARQNIDSFRHATVELGPDRVNKIVALGRVLTIAHTMIQQGALLVVQHNHRIVLERRRQIHRVIQQIGHVNGSVYPHPVKLFPARAAIDQIHVSRVIDGRAVVVHLHRVVDRQRVGAAERQQH